MRFVTYLLKDNVERLGIMNSDMTGVYEIKSIPNLQNSYKDMNDFIANITQQDLETMKKIQ